MSTAILLHGSGDSPATWATVVQALGDGWTCLRPRPEEVRRARAVEPFVLVGHSYGGWEALRFAASEPAGLAALVLIEPVAFGVLEGWDDDALEVVRAASEPFALKSLVEFWHGPEGWTGMPANDRFRLMAEEPRLRRQGARALRLPAVVDERAAFSAPTTIAWGSETRAEEVRVCERLADLLPAAHTAVLDGARHASLRSHADAIAELIEAAGTAPRS